jgi:hypothetical protein
LKGRLRVGAWLVCVGLVAAGLYLAFNTQGPAAFDRIEGTLHDVTVVPNGDPNHPDRIHQLSITGAPCGDYHYLESWARSAGLPGITDLDANRPITVYADAHACAGFNGGGSAPVRALIFEGRLYATDAYNHPRNARFDNLPAALLLLLTGLAGAGLLVYRTALGWRRLTVQ